MYLSKEKKQDIASMVTAIVVTREMWMESVDKGLPLYKIRERRDWYCRSVIDLHDKFGIKMHDYDMKVKWLNEPKHDLEVAP